MEAKIVKIVNSEYPDRFEIHIQFKGATFISLAVYSKENIKYKFQVSEEEFNNLKK